MPTRSIANQYCVGPRCYLRADFIKVLGHGLGVGSGHDDRGADTACGTNRSEQISLIMSVIAHHSRTGANRRPDISERTLLTDSGFILEPDLNRRSGSGGEKGFFQQARK